MADDDTKRADDADEPPARRLLLEEVNAEVDAAYREHRDAVHAYLIGRGLSRADADEATQETYLVYRNHVTETVLVVNRLAFLLALARGLYSNHQRRAQTSPLTIGLPSSRGERPASGPGVESRVAGAELRARVRADLPAELQPLFDLVIVHDLTEAEAAAALDRPLGTVNTQVRRLKRILSEMAEKLR